MSVPKVFLYTGLRERLVLQQLKLASTPSTPTLLKELKELKELENLEARISAARNVLIKAGGDEPHDDLADALAVWAASEYENAREDARRRGARVSRPPPTKAAWT